MSGKPHHTMAYLTGRLQPLVFFAWLYAYLWLLFGDRYRAFIQPRFWLLVILGAVITFLFLISTLWRRWPHGHGPTGTGLWIRAAILCLPLLYLWTAFGAGLGAHALTKRSLEMLGPLAPLLQSAGPSPNVDAKNPTDNTIKGMVPLSNLMFKSERYLGRHIVTEGKVFRRKGMPKNQFMLFRFFMICCAADAIPLLITVNSPVPVNLKNDLWVRVEGRLQRGPNPKSSPYIAAEKIKTLPTPPPGKQYLYFSFSRDSR